MFNSFASHRLILYIGVKVPRESRFQEWILFKCANNLMIGFARNSRVILYSSFTDRLSMMHGARRMLTLNMRYIYMRVCENKLAGA